MATGFLLLFTFGPATAQVPRFTARLADGTRLAGERLSGWHEEGGQAQLDGRALLDPANPLIWLRDQTKAPAAPPPAWVETFLGDRLPGTVTAHVPHRPSAGEQLAAHLVVEPSVALFPPRNPEDTRLRVVTTFVRRIVWQSQESRPYQPSTLYLRDGNRLSFRALRWGADSVRVLLSDGQRQLDFAELAEVHLPVRDPWDVVFEELATLAPQASTRMLQLETKSGLIATGSLERFRAYSRGNPNDFSRWVHGIQPAWSLDVLWVPQRQIMMHRSYASDQLPLTRLDPVAAEQQSPLARMAWPWQRNRNVRGGPLRSGGHDAGWGFGVHATCRLGFALHPAVTGIHTAVGLDHLAGDGGCVQARVSLGDDAPLYESPVLVGSGRQLESADCRFPPIQNATADSRRLVLLMDMAHETRPAGADPLDVRDSADWVEPMLLLDRQRIGVEVAARFNRSMVAWTGWQLQREDTARLRRVNLWDPFSSAAGRFVPAVVADEPFFLTRDAPPPAERWLVIGVSHPQRVTRPPHVELLIDDEVVARHPVPPRNPAEPNPKPLVILLPANASPDVTESWRLRQIPGASTTPVRWETVHFAHHHPTRRAIFEEQARWQAVEPTPANAIEVTDKERYSGNASLRVLSPGQVRLTLENPLRVREHPQWGQVRFLRFAFRKTGGGRVSVEVEPVRARTEPLRYDAGTGPAAFGAAKRIWQRELPDEWTVITRDLFSDFGEIDIASLVLGVPDGQHAHFDHIYLGRTAPDLPEK